MSSSGEFSGRRDVVGPPSSRVQGLRERVAVFLEEHVLPAEEVLEAHASGEARWTIHPRMEELKEKVCVCV